ncbi:hypothetical protein G6M02_14250 [Agrobacterium rhizogenes]|nr:hypothetical protein [Rhizobium rhizogenes]
MPVGASFHSVRDAVVSAVDGRFAETIRLSPMSGGAKDQHRPQLEIEAVLRTGAEKSNSVDIANPAAWQSKIAAGKALLYIDRNRYPDIVVRKQDAVRAVARHGQPVFEVSLADDRNHTRLIVELVHK